MRNLNLDDGVIDIRYPVRNSSVSIQIPTALALILADWIGKLPPDCDNVLPGVKMQGQWHETTRGGFNPHYQLGEFCRAHEIGKLTFESLRRYHVERPRHTDFGLDAGREDECVIIIGEFGKPVLIYGEEPKRLRTPYRHKLVKFIVDGGRAGRSATEIQAHMGTTGWWQVLDAIRKMDRPWEKALLMPGASHGGNYRAAYSADLRRS